MAHVQFAPSAYRFAGSAGLLPALLPAGPPLITTVHEYGGWAVPGWVPERAWRPLEAIRAWDREAGRLVPASSAVIVTNPHHAHLVRRRTGRRAVELPHAADAAVLPFTAGVTRKSGALLAALAHGVPTAVTLAEEPDGRLRDGETVAVIPRRRDTAAVVAALRPLLHDPAVRRRLAAAADCLPPAARRPPVVLVPDVGMAVKRWPEWCWTRLVDILADHGHPVLSVTPGPPVPFLPAGNLRHLAACFAAVARRGGVVVGGDTGPVRLAAAAGARTVALFGPTVATRYGLGVATGVEVQGRPDCPHRRPTAITEQVCWWDAHCPLATAGPACMAGIDPEVVAGQVFTLIGR